MSYKDLLVVLDSGTASRGRIELAAALAERFAAHLVGLYPLAVPEAPRHLGYYDPALLDPFFRELREKAQEVSDTERAAFEHARVAAECPRDRLRHSWLRPGLRVARRIRHNHPD